MAKSRISALAAIATIALSATDVLPVVDTAGPTTNKVTMAQMRTALFAGGAGYASDPLSVGALTAAGGTFTALTVSPTAGSDSHVTIDAPAGKDSSVVYASAGVPKWFVGRGVSIGTVQDYVFYGASAGAIAMRIADTTHAVTMSGTLGVTGAIATAASMSVGGAFAYGFSGRSQITSPADGQLTLLDSTSNQLSVLSFGIHGDSPAFKNTDSGTSLSLRRADDAGYTNFFAAAITASSTISSGASVVAAAASSLGWTGRSLMQSPADGKIVVTNAAGTAFTSLALGGTTSAFPSIKRNAGAINLRLADDSADASLTLLNLTASGTVTATGGVVGALTGNASTATTLATARTINGVAFDGSGNITVTAAAGTLTGTTLNGSVVTSSLTSVGTLASLAVTGTVNTSAGVYQVAGTQVVGTRDTGWATQTGPTSKANIGGVGAFTLDGLAALVRAIQAAMVSHGLIGA